MEYPLISEYREAILSSEDNFNELASLRPVLDSYGDPVMSSGNFAVVFKMRDENDGKLYAVKCFIKDQAGRDESYRKIADELETVSSSYILPLRYLENELFVDSAQCEQEEFPVVVMEWVEGETLDSYLNRNIDNKYELEMLGYRFNRMAAWLLAQPFAHGDLKPDNILVRKDGSLVLVDYDGMFVPSMKGEKAREIGSPDYRHPLRTDIDFDEHIDDFSIAVIALSMKAIALNRDLKSKTADRDTLFFSEQDFCSPQHSESLKALNHLAYDRNLSMLLGIFYIALAKTSLEKLSFRLFLTDKPQDASKRKRKFPKLIVKIDTTSSNKEISEGIADEFGVIYSADGKRLLRCKNNLKLSEYTIKPGTEVICDMAFSWCESLQSVTIPGTVTAIGKNPFLRMLKVRIIISSNSNFQISNDMLISANGILIACLNSSRSVSIPNSVTSIGYGAFWGCHTLESVIIPDSVTTIGDFAFYACFSLERVSISDSVTSIGKNAFSCCESLIRVSIPNSVTTIEECVFSGCESLRNIIIPDSVTTIGDNAFTNCKSLESVSIPDSIISIGKNPFRGCPTVRIV